MNVSSKKFDGICVLLKAGDSTTYLCLPPKHIRLFYNCKLNTVVK